MKKKIDWKHVHSICDVCSKIKCKRRWVKDSDGKIYRAGIFECKDLKPIKLRETKR